MLQAQLQRLPVPRALQEPRGPREPRALREAQDLREQRAIAAPRAAQVLQEPREQRDKAEASVLRAQQDIRGHLLRGLRALPAQLVRRAERDPLDLAFSIRERSLMPRLCRAIRAPTRELRVTRMLLLMISIFGYGTERHG